MNYAGIIKNDTGAGNKVNVSLYVSGCPLKCKGCHNAEMQDYNYGKPLTTEVIQDIVDSIVDNGVQRNFSILGGEPLAPPNLHGVARVINAVRCSYPDIEIYLWTGYTLEQINNRIIELCRGSSKDQMAEDLIYIMNNIDFLIDGPYIEAERDITLPLRGSRNQRIIQMNEVLK